MHVISTTSQVVKVIPREKTLVVTLNLRDEQTQEITTKAIVGSLDGNYVSFDLNFVCIEGNYYTFQLNEGDSLLYYGMLFCTNETEYDAYKITEGEYTSPSSNNEYIFNE